ncbi:MAG: type II secretion system F family protein [Candidatus Sumerlaeota bacterium]|nr:type II secretion system F family protein [Candidatus Sumerlaeota bacterium]
MFRLFSLPRRIEDLALFTRHTAGAMAARAPLPDILRAYAHDSEPGAVARAVEAMAARIETGASLSDAMEENAKVFPAAYRRLVQLGERSRTLAGVLSQLAGALEEGLKTYESFRRAAVYPLLITILLFLDVCFIGAFLLPKFADMYAEMGQDMPIPAAIRLFETRLPLWIIGAIALVPVVFLMCAALGLRLRGFGYGRFWLMLPLVGPALRRLETALFANHLSLLLQNRIPLAEALGLLADSSSNSYVRAAVEDFHRRYQAGERLGDLIAAQPLFPATMATVIAAAEDQGGLAETLRSLGQFYGDRASHSLTVIRETFEPILLLMVGVLLGAIMLVMYLPLFKIAGLIK